MRTQTHTYLDHEVDALPATFDRMEETGWSIRQIVILERLSTTTRELPVGTARQTVKIVSLIVVYERIESYVAPR